MNRENKKGAGLCPAIRLAVELLWFFFFFATLSPACAALVFQDDYEKDNLNADITEVFRTPAIGPALSAAWYHALGNLVIQPSARVVDHLDGKAARVEVPQFCALDYIEYLGTALGGKVFLLSWDIEVGEVNGGWGMFLIRFPTADPPNSMQVLFGFLDDGRIIRFSGKPAVDTLVPVGTFLPGVRYSVRFVYDLVAKSYSAALNGETLVDREPIPVHFDLAAIDKFGFDINQRLDLPEHTPQGNVYHVDNIRLIVLDAVYLPLILRGQ